MFTGIVEETGEIHQIEKGERSIRLVVKPKICAKGVRVGDSVAVNGCCLTVVKIGWLRGLRTLHFDLLQETWMRTNLQYAVPGGLVNLERSLRMSDRLGGHFVTGHVDGLGKVLSWERQGSDWMLDLEVPKEMRKYMVFKGSIALDGISLTVAGVSRTGIRLWIIPHTYDVTTLRERRVGDWVNLEADLLGKYVERILAQRKETS